LATRGVKRLVKPKPTMEGAGVRLRRAFGFGATEDYDPFLLLDDFRSERPETIWPACRWHPHRGIEWSTETAWETGAAYLSEPLAVLRESRSRPATRASGSS
jgi:hypothetical protein